MTVVALSIEPYAAAQAFPSNLAQALGLELVDLRSFEREVASMCAAGPDAVVDLVPSHLTGGRWRIRTTDLAARLSEFVLETALRGHVLITGWSAGVVLRPLPHVATVNLRSSIQHRAATLQHHLRYTHFGSALLDLASEDLAIDHLVSRLLQAQRGCPDLAELMLDTGRVSAPVCIDLIKRLVDDCRCVESSAAQEMIHRRLVALR